jgi:hypothetical protein
MHGKDPSVKSFNAKRLANLSDREARRGRGSRATRVACNADLSDRRDEARTTFVDIYNWLDTGDFKDDKALLDQLSA